MRKIAKSIVANPIAMRHPLPNLVESAELFLLFVLSASSVVKSRRLISPQGAAASARRRSQLTVQARNGVSARKQLIGRRVPFPSHVFSLIQSISAIRSVNPCHPWLPLPFSPSC